MDLPIRIAVPDRSGCAQSKLSRYKRQPIEEIIGGNYRN